MAFYVLFFIIHVLSEHLKQLKRLLFFHMGNSCYAQEKLGIKYSDKINCYYGNNGNHCRLSISPNYQSLIVNYLYQLSITYNPSQIKKNKKNVFL